MRYLFALSLFLLTACSQQYALRPEGIGSYEIARVQVSTELPTVEDETATLAAMVVDALQERSLYQRVLQEQTATQAKTLLIDIVIIDIDRSADVQRIAFGTLARSNEVTAEVSLIDDSTANELSSFRLQGVSPRRTGVRIDWPWGSVELALQQISHELARQLDDWSRSPDQD